ncbi:AmmeMemoRadiSam system protein B [Candidatus Woesearchaeota archaeon]|nr:AmmeMemoRadiSam system protein B [Candidatus Woesearchaeota archaeon]
MRKAAFAGLFYERGEVSLQKQLKACFEGERGPGAVPPERQTQKKASLPQGVIVPHAGYGYSGACAAWGYKALGEAPLPDVYVILAPSHKSARSGLTQEPFETPLGIVRVDQDLARRLLEKGHVKEDDELHAQEHSVEVQLPFLQFINKDAMEKVKILPLLIGQDADLDELAVDLKEVLLDTGKKASYIVSSDFTHYGRNYHYLPFTSDAQHNIAALDKGAIDRVQALDAEGFLRYVDDKMATICGAYPIALLLKLLKKPVKASLEQYYTSAVVTRDEKNSVSYATIVFS